MIRFMSLCRSSSPSSFSPSQHAYACIYYLSTITPSSSVCTDERERERERGGHGRGDVLICTYTCSVCVCVEEKEKKRKEKRGERGGGRRRRKRKQKKTKGRSRGSVWCRGHRVDTYYNTQNKRHTKKTHLFASCCCFFFFFSQIQEQRLNLSRS